MPLNSFNTELIVKFSGDIFKVSHTLNATVEIIDCNYAVLTLPSALTDSLYNFDEIDFFEPAKDVTASPILYHEKGNTGIRHVKNGRYNLSGKGVIIGIIDSGVDFTHNEFIAPNGKSRILYMWDQSVDGNPPNGFIFGTEYDNNIICRGLSSENPYEVVPYSDYIGHGTAVTGIAAGNSGIASEADIISVKLGHSGSAKTTDILRGVKYLTDKATILKKPLVINISYGMNSGSHSGDSLFESCLNSMCTKGKTSVVAAAGNEGGSGHHFSTILHSGITEEVEFVCPSVSENLFLDIWKNFNDTIDLELIAPDGSSSGTINSHDTMKKLRFKNYSVTVYYKPITHYSQKQEIVFLFGKDNFISGVWKLLIQCKSRVDGKIDMWLPTVAEVTAQTSFLRPDDFLTLTLPSTVENIISTGGYNSLLDSIAPFSGNGSEFIRKPDISAPAVNIYSSKTGGGYDSFSGTSMAAPFVSGSAALMMEWGIVNENMPFLYGQMLKAYLLKGATRNKNIKYPDSRWGYGSLNLSRTMELLESDL